MKLVDYPVVDRVPARTEVLYTGHLYFLEYLASKSSSSEEEGSSLSLALFAFIAFFNSGFIASY